MAGGKGANLGELARAGVPVPTAFVITTDAYVLAIEEGGLRGKLRQGDGSPSELRSAVAALTLPRSVRRAIVEAFHDLGPDARVAVRSSAAAEDSPGASFAGMNESFTNVVGELALLESVVACWASLWSERAVAYRQAQGMAEEPQMAVVVQRMVDADRSGVMFTVDPTRGTDHEMLIEAAYGLGEVVVGGQVEPDSFESIAPSSPSPAPASAASANVCETPRAASGERPSAT